MQNRRRQIYILHDVPNGIIMGEFDGDQIQELIGLSKSNINKFNIDSGLLYKKRYAVEYDSLNKAHADIPKEVWVRWDNVRKSLGNKLERADETTRKKALMKMREKELQSARKKKS